MALEYSESLHALFLNWRLVSLVIWYQQCRLCSRSLVCSLVVQGPMEVHVICFSTFVFRWSLMILKRNLQDAGRKTGTKITIDTVRKTVKGRRAGTEIKRRANVKTSSNEGNRDIRQRKSS